MTETAVEEKANGIPVPEEGTEEFARMNKMAKIAIPIVLIIFTMGVLQQQAFGMIYVNIGDQLGQANLAPLITSIPGIVLGIVCVIYGSLGDFVSLKKMMILGTIVFVLGSILGCFGDLSIWIVIAARTVQSAGWQVSGSIFLVLVSKYIEKKKRVIWYGVFVAVFRIAAALGVFLAGYMTLVDWRILFGIGIIAVFFIPILAKNLPDEHAKGARIDVIGFTLIGLFAGSVTMFFTDMTIFWGIAVLVTGVAFVVYINKAADPFITPEMLTNPAFAMTMIVIFVGYFFSYTLNAGCNAIGLNVYGIDSSQVSNLLVWSIILAAIMGFAAGPMLAATVIAFPLMYRSARGALEQVDENLIYAARTLGFSEWKIFFKVSLPACLPGIAGGAVLAFARGLGEFGATSMIAGNILGKTRTLPLAVYSAVAAGDFDTAGKYVIVIVLLSFLAVVLLNYFALREKRNRKGKKSCPDCR